MRRPTGPIDYVSRAVISRSGEEPRTGHVDQGARVLLWHWYVCGHQLSVSYCQCMEQVDCTALSQGAASGTTRPLSALLIGINLLVPFTRQTMVLALHTVYVLKCVPALDSQLFIFLGRHWYAGCGHARTTQCEPLALVSRMPAIYSAQPKGEGGRGSPRSIFPALNRRRVARSFRARRSTRTSAR